MGETKLVRDVHLKIGARIGTRLFRNNVGRYQDRSGNWVQYGLCVGSSDLIGWHSVTITPDMVGQTIARFLAIETKMPGKRMTPEQQNFIEAVKRSGGIAGVAFSVEDACQLLNISCSGGTLTR